MLDPAVDITSLTFMQDRMKACVIANTSGYFWLPCPLCGIEFGGHEWSYKDYDKPPHIPDPSGLPGRYVGICPYCTKAGRGHN